jgi:hypothetical protein
MLHERSLRDGVPVHNPDSAFRHWYAVMVTKIQREPLSESPSIGRVLALVVNVDMRLARVAGVAAASYDLPLPHLIANHYRHAVAP